MARHDPPRLVYVRDPHRERRLTEAADWRFFLRECYGQRGPARRQWLGQRLPSGDQMTRERWEKYTERLIHAGLAIREYERGPLELCGDYRQALQTFRESLG